MFKPNSDYKILSPTGFVNFKGIQKVYKPFYHQIIFDDNTEIKCSNTHPFGKSKVTPEQLQIGDILDGKEIVYNEIVEEGIWLYDPIDVGNDNLYYANSILSHNCNFLGSIDTLITAAKLKTLIFDEPITRNVGLDIYEIPKEDHTYLMTVDVSRGTENDYHAFIIFDITTIPYKVVGKYRNNEIKPFVYSTVIEKVARSYNNAYCLIEVNDIGEQVAKELHMDLEYDNVLMCSMRGRAGQVVGQGFSGRKSQFGIKMSKLVKRVGCSNLKTIIEDDKLLIGDYDIISELTTFISKNNSFEADDGYNDDLAMCLVIFSWLIVQDYFKEMTNNDVRKRIYEEQKDQIEQDMTPFGFIVDGLNEEEKIFVDTDGDTWITADAKEDTSYMWNYL